MTQCQRNAQYPIERDPNKIFIGKCEPRDGLMRQGTPETMPAYALNVSNPKSGDVGDSLWADENFNVIVTDDLQFISVNNL